MEVRVRQRARPIAIHVYDSPRGVYDKMVTRGLVIPPFWSEVGEQFPVYVAASDLTHNMTVDIVSMVCEPR